MSDTQAFQDLLDHTAEIPIQYDTISFPMIHLGDGLYEFAGGNKWPLAELGAGYLSERFKDYKYSTFTQWWREGAYDEIARVMNENLHRLKPSYTAAIYDGKIVGVMASYNPVPHVELVENIKRAGIEKSVKSFFSTNMDLRINLKVSSHIDDGVVFYLTIVNGHSGHYALRYYTSIRAYGYEYANKTESMRKRHLSNVNEVVKAMKKSMQDALDSTIDDRLLALTYEQSISAIRKANKFTSARQEQLLVTIEGMGSDKPNNGMEIIALLGQYASTRGYGQGVKKLLDPLIEYAKELV